jgi:dienelactone hydrolase
MLMLRWSLLVGLIFPALTAQAELTAIKIMESSTPFSGSVLYTPNDGKPHPGIVYLHGSEGGSLPNTRLKAQFLAAHGYAVLAFCWYNCGKDTIRSPFDPLENIELRHTIKAMNWMKNSMAVGGKAMALIGVSRGGEQAVVLGTIEDATKLVDVIAVHTPSDTVVSGLNWSARDKRCWICATGDLACFNDSNEPRDWNWSEMKWNPACGNKPEFPSQTNSWMLDGTPLKLDSVIEIEKFKKPVFITVGDKDDIWDYKKSLRLAERLTQFKQPVEFHLFPGEHHKFSQPAENQRQDLLLKFLKQLDAP